MLLIVIYQCHDSDVSDGEARAFLGKGVTRSITSDHVPFPHLLIGRMIATSVNPTARTGPVAGLQAGKDARGLGATARGADAD